MVESGEFDMFIFRGTFGIVKVPRRLLGNVKLQLPPHIGRGIKSWRLAGPVGEVPVDEGPG